MKTDRPRQPTVRGDLHEIVITHLNAPWRRPVAAHSAAAFNTIQPWVTDSAKPLIIDSCCGTGDSTRRLAAQFPDALVIGVDKSADRLSRHQQGREQNYAVLRADVNDFWRLAAAAGWRPRQHYLLYPNPYPKAAQFRKRWYGSPAFPSLLALGGLLTVRSNWSIYAQEFALALRAAGFTSRESQVSGTPALSAFEAKYGERGDKLYEVVCDLSGHKDPAHTV